jgi:NAD(P)-dependent dehydrogenase (short-subunit alcohol dehydrogenase family)
VNCELRTANCELPLVTSLSGKSALITGGARRIGRAIALELAHAGADITITYRSSADEAVETVDAIEQLGRRGFAIECNVRSEQSVRDAIASTIAEHNHLDILVNNAGLFETAPLDQLTLPQWDAMFETNARGPFLLSREALPHLRAARGRIINLGSLGGLMPWASHAHYCSSKAAVHMLTQAQAKAFAPDVAVNCVAPGWIEQEEEAGPLSVRFAARTPMRRNGTAEDVAQAVLFFATATEFITGQILVVDGGLSL